MYLSGYEQYTHITWYTVFTKYKIQVCLSDIFKTVFCTSGHKANINFCTDFFFLLKYPEPCKTMFSVHRLTLETKLELLGEFSNVLPSAPYFGWNFQKCSPSNDLEVLEGH